MPLIVAVRPSLGRAPAARARRGARRGLAAAGAARTATPVSTETGLLAGVAGLPVRPLAWRATGLGAGFSSVAVVGDRIYTMGDKDGAQHVIALNAADGKHPLDGEGRRRLGRRVRRPARHAHRGRRPRLRHRHRGRPRLPRGGHGQGALAQEPAPRLRRLDDVDVEVQRVAAGGRRPPDRSPRARATRRWWRWTRGRARRSGGRRPGPRRRRASDGAGYSSIVISNGGGREAVRPAPRPRPRGRPRQRRQVPLGLQPRRQRRGQHPDARSCGRTACSPPPATRRARPCSSCTRPATASPRAEVYFLDAKTFQNHHGGLVLVGNHVYAGPRPQPRASPSASSSRRARSRGAATSATRARARRR